MRALNYSENPVQQAYNGGDQLNIRQMQNFHIAVSQNFNELERTINTLETNQAALTHKLNAAYEFINWVQQHSPETLREYKAHNIVTRVFDKAQDGEQGYMEASA